MKTKNKLVPVFLMNYTSEPYNLIGKYRVEYAYDNMIRTLKNITNCDDEEKIRIYLRDKECGSLENILEKLGGLKYDDDTKLFFNIVNEFHSSVKCKLSILGVTNLDVDYEEGGFDRIDTHLHIDFGNNNILFTNSINTATEEIANHFKRDKDMVRKYLFNRLIYDHTHELHSFCDIFTETSMDIQLYKISHI